ncbi:amidohydrolase family protein [Subdoligranulum sp. DSM 109015]|uniref:Amidohydrolase family protein n=1 Tax=Gemmiger gallinarum TaxID=2779354 RepID=A0ABR9R1Y2_9FIRM|nr:amidohydrolase family protein [Gemmiger gallinarum]MBE5037154.1 amidohydrolase family protein [Gemmiger gallinarum]
MQEKTFALKGNIIYTPECGKLELHPHSYLVCEDGKVAGIFDGLPRRWQGIRVEDYGDKLILPGLVDLHVHASQYAYRGLGMDMELLDWLECNAFPEESRFADLSYARRAYGIFTDALTRSATTRACIFATLHRPAALVLMEQLEQAGLPCYVGKVNMDRNSPDILRETTEQSLEETRLWLEQSRAFTLVRPMLTPRFIPSCTDELMAGLGRLQREFGTAMQSHLSENLSEIRWVSELCPDTRFYGEAYARAGLFGGDCPTVMAHCVWSGEEERALMKENGVFIAHCPQSNINVSSGIAPVKNYLKEGQKVGLGSDVAGGAHLSIFRAMTDAIQSSKLRWRLVDQDTPALTLPEAFYMATKGGGAFFGKVGSFEPGYDFDAVVMDDAELPTTRDCTLAERLERVVYLSDGRPCAKYAAGKRLF